MTEDVPEPPTGSDPANVFKVFLDLILPIRAIVSHTIPTIRPRAPARLDSCLSRSRLTTCSRSRKKRSASAPTSYWLARMPARRPPASPPPHSRRVRQPAETGPALHAPRLIRPLAALLAKPLLDVPAAPLSVQRGVARAARRADVRRRWAPACGALPPRPLLAAQGLPVPSFTRPTLEAPARLDTVAVPAPLRAGCQELGHGRQRSSRRPRPVQTAARPQLPVAPATADVERRVHPRPPLPPLGTRRTVRRSGQVGDDHGCSAVAK